MICENFFQKIWIAGWGCGFHRPANEFGSCNPAFRGGGIKVSLFTIQRKAQPLVGKDEIINCIPPKTGSPLRETGGDVDCEGDIPALQNGVCDGEVIKVAIVKCEHDHFPGRVGGVKRVMQFIQRNKGISTFFQDGYEFFQKFRRDFQWRADGKTAGWRLADAMEHEDVSNATVDRAAEGGYNLRDKGDGHPYVGSNPRSCTSE